MADTQPNMEALERDIADPKPIDPTIAKFAPPRIRQAAIPNGELQAILNDQRKWLAHGNEIRERMQTFCDTLKVNIETMQRAIG